MSDINIVDTPTPGLESNAGTNQTPKPDRWAFLKNPLKTIKESRERLDESRQVTVAALKFGSDDIKIGLANKITEVLQQNPK